jgi:hypothetical protein
MRELELARGFDEGQRLMLDTIMRAAGGTGRTEVQLMEQEGLLAQIQSQWFMRGARILDFTPSLVEALRHSDAGDMRLSDLVGDSEMAFYLHFGPQQDLLLADGQPLEGLMVVHMPERGFVRMLMMGRRTGSWPESGAGETQMLRFRLEDMKDLPFDEAVEAAVELDITDIRTGRAKLEAMGAKPTLDFQAMEDRQRKNAGTYREALRLAGNALAYLKAYPEDIIRAWQPGTPSSLQEKASRPGKEGPRAESKLRSMGFRPVEVVGLEFEEADARAAAGGPRSPHWRRGHWRHQAHGPQLSLRKLIWIRPVRVLGHAEEVAAPYSADAP